MNALDLYRFVRPEIDLIASQVIAVAAILGTGSYVLGRFDEAMSTKVALSTNEIIQIIQALATCCFLSLAGVASYGVIRSWIWREDKVRLCDKLHSLYAKAEKLLLIYTMIHSAYCQKESSVAAREFGRVGLSALLAGLYGAYHVHQYNRALRDDERRARIAAEAAVV